MEPATHHHVVGENGVASGSHLAAAAWLSLLRSNTHTTDQGFTWWINGGQYGFRPFGMISTNCHGFDRGVA